MKRWLTLLGMTLLLGCGDDYPMRAGGEDIPSTLRFSPANSMVEVGQTFTASIEVVDAQELFGIAFEVVYDPELLEATQVASGPALGGDVLFFEQEEEGRICVAVTKKRGASPLTGSGVIARLTFVARGAGRSNLSFVQSAVEPADRSGLAVMNIDRFIVQSGSVNVLVP